MRLERIEFLDHYSVADWTTVEDAASEDFSAMRSVSVGWVVAENETCIRLCPNLDGDEASAVNCWGCFVIPKCAIIRRDPLAVQR